MKAIGWVVVIALALIILSILGAVFGWFGRGAQLVQEQVDPYEFICATHNTTDTLLAPELP